jgi:hypothetical protein
LVAAFPAIRLRWHPRWSGTVSGSRSRTMASGHPRFSRRSRTGVQCSRRRWTRAGGGPRVTTLRGRSGTRRPRGARASEGRARSGVCCGLCRPGAATDRAHRPAV